MPKLIASCPKYRKHRASGQAVVTICGRDQYLGPYGTKSSRAEYDRMVGEWIASGRPATVPASPDEITVTELAAAYWKHAEQYYRKNGVVTRTAENLKYSLRFLRELYGHTTAANFGPLALKSLQRRMVDAGQSRTYANMNVDRIKRLFKWGVSEQLVPVAVHQALATVEGLRKGRTAARETGPVLPVDDATIDATLPHLPEVVADMVRLQRLTGMRPGELCSMRPCDVDATGDTWTYRPSSHKTEHHGRERAILIGPRGQVVLRPYLLRASDAFCFSPADSERKRRTEQHQRRTTPLSCGDRPGSNRKAKPKRTPSDRYVKDSYTRVIHRACGKAGVPPWSPNRLRHAAATEIRKRFGLEAAQVALGHATANITQVYAERDLTLAANVMRQIG